MVEQVLSEMSAAGRVFEAFYIRTSDQHEADMVLMGCPRNQGNLRFARALKLVPPVG